MAAGMDSISQNTFLQLIRNPVFLAPLFSWFTAQFLKALIELVRQSARSSKEAAAIFLWRTGGMPSSHSAAVAGLTTSIAFKEGVNSSIFIGILCFALIVIRDALGVRRASGQQAQLLNKLARHLSESDEIDFNTVKEIHGHTPAEVMVGIILGFFIALAFFYL